MKTEQYLQSRKDNLVIQELNGELLIYDLTSNKVYCLNETAAMVWQLCDGNTSLEKISQSISKKLESTVTEDFVWLAIEGLKKVNLLANSREREFVFKGLNRREVIRKAGFTSVAALPLISSIVAPTAAKSASGEIVCAAEGEPCVNASDCCPVSQIQNCQEDCFTGQKVCLSGVGGCL